jgi:hypothetical protein
MEWKPPERVITEEERRATQARLEAFKVLGRAVDADFDVAEELRRRGMKTNAEVDAEREAAEAAKAATTARKSELRAEAAERAETRAELDGIAAQLRDLEGR